MNVPTSEEIAAALYAYTNEGPKPMAAAVDRSRDLGAALFGLADNLRQLQSHEVEEFAQRCKALLVLGLNIGIRIGEARRAQCSGPWLHGGNYNTPTSGNNNGWPR